MKKILIFSLLTLSLFGQERQHYWYYGIHKQTGALVFLGVSDDPLYFGKMYGIDPMAANLKAAFTSVYQSPNQVEGKLIWKDDTKWNPLIPPILPSQH